MLQAAGPLLRQLYCSSSKAVPAAVRCAVQRCQTTTASAAAAAASTGPAPVEAYSRATSLVHWLMGGGILACFGSVQAAMWTKDKERKGEIMTVHKSTGLAVAALVIPRLALALLARRPGGLPGSPAWEHMVASATHYALYGFMITMPVTGIAMGYYGGKGLPFYGYFTIPGAEKPNGGVAKNAFMVHKTAGLFFEYMVPMHIGAATMHAFKGQKIFQRVNPFRAASPA